MSIAEQKERLRQSAQSRRREVAQAAGSRAGAQLAAHAVSGFGHLAGYAMSGYLAIGTEIDVSPTMAALDERGLITALPVVTGPARPLLFRQWHGDMKLEAGPLGTRHPPPSAPDVMPDLLIIPMLAFDLSGYRMGWGGGFYDRTLAALRRQKQVIAIGAAFAAQQVDKVPIDDHDARLDWIVTEAGLIEIAA